MKRIRTLDQGTSLRPDAVVYCLAARTSLGVWPKYERKDRLNDATLYKPLLIWVN